LIFIANDLKHCCKQYKREAVIKKLFKAHTTQYFWKECLVKLYSNSPCSIILFQQLSEHASKRKFKSLNMLKNHKNGRAEAWLQDSHSVVALEMCKVCKCTRPPTWFIALKGLPP